MKYTIKLSNEESGELVRQYEWKEYQLNDEQFLGEIVKDMADTLDVVTEEVNADYAREEQMAHG